MKPWWKPALQRQWQSVRVAALMRYVQLRALAGAPPLQRMLLISDGIDYTSEQQFAPLWRYATAIARSLGLVCRHCPLERAIHLPATTLRSYQRVGLKLSWRTDRARAVRTVQHFAAALAGSDTRLLYFDGDDDLCVQWPELLTLTDGYIKKHVFADRAAYGRTYVGKSNLTDHVAHAHGWSFAGDPIASTGPLTPEQAVRIVQGWNIAFDDKIQRMLERGQTRDHDHRTLDVLTRCHVKPDVWIHPLRDPALEAIAALAPRFRVQAPRERVNQTQYNQELSSARICISPFGYGELCWRDFEAIAAGCLLVKPDAGHVRTYPDIFRADATYVPVRWDFADLADRCMPYLQDEAARRRVAEQARQTLLDACRPAAFVSHLRGVLQAADALPRSPLMSS